MAGSRRALALLVAGAFFLENLDGTVLSTAAPKIGVAFGVAAVDVNVAMTAYLLTLAVFIPASGWIADRFGSRRVFFTAIATFTLASAACAATQNLPELTATRVLQGLGGAMMVPVGRLVVLRVTPKADLLTAIAYLTWPALVAPVLGPAVGGVITTYASWRWIFLINVPLGAVALALVGRLVPDVRADRRTPLDWAGFATSGSGLGLTVAGLEDLGLSHPDPWVVGGCCGAGVLLLAVSVRHLLTRPDPLVDLRTLRVPTFRNSALAGSTARMVVSAVPFLLTLTFQVGWGWSPVRAGIVVAALFVGNLGIKPLTTPSLRRFGFRTVLAVATVGCALSLLLSALLGPTTPVALVVLVLIVSGACRSTTFTAYSSMAFADVPTAAMTHANTLAATLQQLSMGLGLTVTALALRLGSPVGREWGLAAPAGAFRVAFVLLALVLVVPVAATVRLPRTAGAAATTAGAPTPAPGSTVEL
jgi:EmrB/QacA subfamily drug resistance transporter